jgi:hypothetical protein
MDKKYIYTGVVKDVQDPLMLNRVRVFFDTTTDGLNNSAILDSVPDTYNRWIHFVFYLYYLYLLK